MAAAVRPDAILKDLHDLWISLGSRAEAEKASGVLRACALTLIVAAEDSDDPAAIAETLAELMREYPSRAIVLRLRPGGQPLLEAKVSAQCWLPRGHRTQICSEQIEITASHASLADVPAVALALTVPDLPVVVWCRGSGVFQLPGFERLAQIAGKLVVDSSIFRDPRPVLERLAARLRSGRLVADLSWTRLTGWRELIARVFEAPGCRKHLAEISGIQVSCAGQTIPASAYYMAAWLAAALGWSPGDRRLRFSAVAGENEALHGVALSSPELSVSVERESDRALDLRVNGLLRRAVLPVLTGNAILGEELAISGHDAVFERTLAMAELIAGSARRS